MRFVKDNWRLEAERGFLYANGEGVWFLDAERVFVVMNWTGIWLKSVPYTRASVEQLNIGDKRLIVCGLAVPVREAQNG